MRRILLYCLFLIQLAFLASATPNYEELRVGTIKVVFARESNDVKGGAVRARLKTKEGALFSQSDFDDDLKLLAKEADRIEPKLEVVDDKIDITLTVYPKPLIHEITWSGNTSIPTDKLQKELGIAPKAIFDRVQFNKAFNKLKAYYVRKGYFEAELNYTIIPTDDQVDIAISVKEGRSGHIAAILFDDFTKKERDAISELVFTKEYSLFTSWLTNEGTLRPEVLKHDELTILSYVHNEGYLDATLATTVEPAKKPGKVIIRFTLNRGPLYRIGIVSVAGFSGKVLPKEELLGALDIRKGTIYSPEKIREATRALYDLYGSKGYIDAHITPDAQLLEGKHIYNVTFRIEEGDRYRVGLVKVLGNSRTDAAVILHETLLVPGDVFNTKLLQRTEERLRNIGYFKNVNVYAAKSSSAHVTDLAHFRDVYVEVEEIPSTGNFNAYVAFSTAEKISGGVGLSESNFNSKGFLQCWRRGPKAFRGGGEYVGINATFGTRQLVYTFSWTKPYFLDTPWTVGMDLEKMRNSFMAQDWSVRSYKAQFFGMYTQNAFVKYGPYYRLQHSFITAKHLHSDRHDHEFIRESKNAGLISAAGAQIFYDSTNHPRAATRGLRSSLKAEFAGLGGDHTFLSLGYLNTYYWAPYPKGLFRLRGNIQFIRTLGGTRAHDLPLNERLYTGGETSIRGYVYNRVGPKFHDRHHTVRGGMSEILLSAEYKQYLMSRLDAFVFFDAGNVYWRQFYLGELRYSTGYGIKIKISENAPVTIGMGYPLNPQHKRDVKKFFLLFESSF